MQQVEGIYRLDKVEDWNTCVIFGVEGNYAFMLCESWQGGMEPIAVLEIFDFRYVYRSIDTDLWTPWSRPMGWIRLWSVWSGSGGWLPTAILSRGIFWYVGLIPSNHSTRSGWSPNAIWATYGSGSLCRMFTAIRHFHYPGIMLGLNVSLLFTSAAVIHFYIPSYWLSPRVVGADPGYKNPRLRPLTSIILTPNGSLPLSKSSLELSGLALSPDVSAIIVDFQLLYLKSGVRIDWYLIGWNKGWYQLHLASG